jgi:hypothetical protein
MPRIIVLLMTVVALLGSAEPLVQVERLPTGGVQPQALTGPDGTLHLVWFTGAPAAGNLLYAKRGPADPAFSAPLRVNSQDGVAVAMGTIRGAQLALGRGSRVHVLWNGSSTAQPKGPDGGPGMLYARLNDEGTAFEAQRQLIQRAGGIDGGGALVADASGHVWAFWHAMAGATDESGRAVYVSESMDDGATFAAEMRATEAPTGACGCCGMRASLDAQGRLQVLFRGATDAGQRDEFLLTRAPTQKTFTGRMLDPWPSKTCPMSSSALSTSKESLILAWETKGRIRFAVASAAGKVGAVQDVPAAQAGAKHPTVAPRADGGFLLAWTEGTGWNKGGAIAWQSFDGKGKPVGQPGRAQDLPVWGLVAAVSRLDGSVLLIY